MSNRGRLAKIATLILIGMTCVAWRAWAADGEDLDRPTLKGLGGIAVLVEYIRPDVERDGISRAQLQTDTELRIRKAGIKVLSKAELMSEPGSPYLYINVNLKKTRGLYANSIRVSFKQRVRLERDPRIVSTAETWEASGLGTCGQDNLSQIRGTVADLVDQFINAYLAENPPAPASQPVRR